MTVIKTLAKTNLGRKEFSSPYNSKVTFLSLIEVSVGAEDKAMGKHCLVVWHILSLFSLLSFITHDHLPRVDITQTVLGPHT